MLSRLILVNVVLGGSLALPASGASLDRILAAIRAVETGHHPNGGHGAKGDGGEALGPYQIHREYWRDAGVQGRYNQCAAEAYSRRVVLAYWRRYCPEALAKGEAQILARIHNGGPDVRGQWRATQAYWEKVKQELGE